MHTDGQEARPQEKWLHTKVRLTWIFGRKSREGFCEDREAGGRQEQKERGERARQLLDNFKYKRKSQPNVTQMSQDYQTPPEEILN